MNIDGYDELAGLKRGREIREMMTEEEKRQADESWQKFVNECLFPFLGWDGEEA